jgi:uncharacterized protein
MSVFVDTSGWGYLFDKSDQELHLQAVQIYRQADQQFVTSNYVLCELVALLHSPLRVPRAQAIAIIDSIRNSARVRLQHVEKSVDDLAWQLLKTRADKQWSLVDCSSFVLMEELKISQVLTTDHHFQQAGFRVLLQANRR